MVKIEEMPRIKDFRFPPSMICYAVWDYHRFELSLRDVEDLLAERGVTVSYETIRDWVARFGTQISAKFCGGRLTPSASGISTRLRQDPWQESLALAGRGRIR